MKCGIPLRLLIPIALGLILLHPVSVDDWTCFKGSPERIGSSDAPTPDTCYLLWEVNTGSELYASPVVTNGNVFQVALERLFCIDCDNGDILWSSNIPVYQSTPALSNKKIIVATNSGISTLSVEKGNALWEYKVAGRFREELPMYDYIVSSPVVSEGRIVVGTLPYSYDWVHEIPSMPDEFYLICLDEATGKEEWFVETCSGFRTSPCVINGRIFAASRAMFCVDLKNGNIIWNSEEKYPHDFEKPVRERYAFKDSTPALYHGILVAGSSTRQWSSTRKRFIEWQKIVFMDQYTGDILWEWVEEGLLASSPSVYKGKVYFYSLDGMVRCLSFLEGKELWRTRISEPREKELYGFRLWPSPTVADGKVYIGSIEGVFYCLDADTGEVLWTYETKGPFRSAPAVVSEKVLISSTDGTLYCFGIDPATYKMKAQQYIEDKTYDKAKQFLVKAKDLAKTDEEIKEIDNLLQVVLENMPEYEKRVEKLTEAESFVDETDKILWDKEFTKAKTLYTKAYEIYTELNDEFGIKFCEKRIDYIEKRIAQQSWIENYWWFVFVLICIGAASILVVKYASKRKKKE